MTSRRLWGHADGRSGGRARPRGPSVSIAGSRRLPSRGFALGGRGSPWKWTRMETQRNGKFNTQVADVVWELIASVPSERSPPSGCRDVAQRLQPTLRVCKGATGGVALQTAQDDYRAGKEVRAQAAGGIAQRVAGTCLVTCGPPHSVDRGPGPSTPHSGSGLFLPHPWPFAPSAHSAIPASTGTCPVRGAFCTKKQWVAAGPFWASGAAAETPPKRE